MAFETLYSKAGEGGTPTTSNTEFYDNGSIPFIKIDDLSNKYLSANKDYITELGLKKSSAWLIPTHSIIYSRSSLLTGSAVNLRAENRSPANDLKSCIIFYFIQVRIG